jgi:hypothetical protein
MSTRGPETQRLERLADVLVTKGIDGDIAAIKEIGDRLEGKPSQSVAFGQDPDLEPVGMEHSLRPTLTRDAWLKLHNSE